MATNVPATEWRPSDGYGEFGNAAAEDIVDPSGVDLVDPSNVQIVSTDSTFTQIPDTAWSEDDSQ